MASEQWANGETCRDLVEDKKWLKELAQAEAGGFPPRTRARPSSVTTLVEVSGKRFEVKVRGEAVAPGANGAAPR